MKDKRIIRLLKYIIPALLAVTAAVFWGMKAEAADPVEYVDENGNVLTASKYTVLDPSNRYYHYNGNYMLGSDVYVVNKDIELSSASFSAVYKAAGCNATLILCDGCTMNVKTQFMLDGGSLHIYGQKGGTGRLWVHPVSASMNSRGYIMLAGKNPTLEIHSGTVCAEGSYGSAGIDTYQNTSSAVNIKGGTVDAKGANYSPAIGATWSGSSAKINITGGNITAVSGYNDKGSNKYQGIGYAQGGMRKGNIKVDVSVLGCVLNGVRYRSPDERYDYIDSSGNEAYTLDYIKLDENNTELTLNSSENMYVADGRVNIDGVMNIAKDRDIQLLLCDGCELNISQAVLFCNNASLTIYVQKNGSGSMTVNGGKVNDKQLRGILMSGNNTEFTIYGGNITSNGNFANIAGIELYGDGAFLDIKGGNIVASGSSKAAGIGSYGINTKVYVAIEGGQVTSICGEDFDGDRTYGIGSSASSDNSLELALENCTLNNIFYDADGQSTEEESAELNNTASIFTDTDTPAVIFIVIVSVLAAAALVILAVRSKTAKLRSERS